MNHQSTNHFQNSKKSSRIKKEYPLLEEHYDLRVIFLKEFLGYIFQHLQYKADKKNSSIKELLKKVETDKKGGSYLPIYLPFKAQQNPIPAEFIKIEDQEHLLEKISNKNVQNIHPLGLSAAPLQSLPHTSHARYPPSNIPPNLHISLPQPSAERIVLVGIAKLELLLKDPSIQSIECPGPDRPILVNKTGLTQATSIALTELEIKDIMQEISDKTKIPIIPGVFKAAINNLIITAVVSDFVGTRFMIQKNYPHPQPIQALPSFTLPRPQ